uniref:Uncharacterized protein n=1 Tax=Branchiostoma floridae TaxID=7739 RepID=C3Y4K6_BRAFL|eukprot:XP_002608653.1 hypothetical protein BRAFLDRAFT_73877 [Branchiostoma floridae]
MAPRFSYAVTFLVTFVFLCSGQSVYRPPTGERCAPCNQVLGVGTDEGLKSELDRMKIVVKQLSRKIADWLKALAVETGLASTAADGAPNGTPGASAGSLSVTEQRGRRRGRSYESAYVHQR